MLHSSDTIVLYIFLFGMVFLIFRKYIRLRTIVNGALSLRKKKAPYHARGDVPDLLREEGYEVVSGREKIELGVSVDDANYESRLYMDYVAHKDDELYLVMVAKERKLVRMSGPALRDAFLSLFLLFRPQGILYVHREKETIQKVTFDIDEFESEQKAQWVIYTYYLIAGFAAGIIIAVWLMFKQ